MVKGYGVSAYNPGNGPAVMRNVFLTRKVEKSGDQQYANSWDEEDDIDEQPELAVVML